MLVSPTVEQEFNTRLEQYATEYTDALDRRFGLAKARTSRKDVQDAADDTDPTPTEDQASAGNYKKGHVTIYGIDITIETPAGATRYGKRHGRPWSAVMPTHYGYIKNTTGADGGQVDIYIGPNPKSTTVWVINQLDDKSGEFDEHKVMLGYKKWKQARKDYIAAFSDGKGKDRIGPVTEMSIDEFKTWLKTEVPYNPDKMKKATYPTDAEAHGREEGGRKDQDYQPPIETTDHPAWRDDEDVTWNETGRLPVSPIYDNANRTVLILAQQVLEAMRGKDASNYPPVSVPIKDIIATQTWIDHESGRYHEAYFGSWAKYPVFARTPDGLLYIVDGHHRADHAVGSGDATLDAWVFPVSGAEGWRQAKRRIDLKKDRVLGLKKAKRVIRPLPNNSAYNKAQAKIADTWRDAFRKIKPLVVKDIAEYIARTNKADVPDDLDKIIAIRLELLDDTVEATTEELISAAQAAALDTLVQLGVDERSDLVNRVNERAERWARERGAELVGKRVLGDGTIIDNPNAEWSIPQTTRDLLRQDISEGMEEGMGVKELSTMMEENYAFSDERATMIARTEVSFAHNAGTMDGIRESDALGINIMKEWLLGPDPCVICIENADEGPIDINDDFPSGDDAPPANPNCECAVVGVVQTEGEQDDTADNEE